VIPATPGFRVEMRDTYGGPILHTHDVIAWADDGMPLVLTNDEGLAKPEDWDLVWSVRGPDNDRPEIVCLCGSTRFIDAFAEANLGLTLDGKIVLSIGCATSTDGGGIDGDTKERLDELHRHKIDLADRVLVLNVGGYIGDSTRREIAYAMAHGKPIEYLETEHGQVAGGTVTEGAP
jgi:hypothetical protein